ACRGVKRGRSAPKRSMSYGDIESDMNSIAQQAVANGYGKIEYLRAQPMARSRRVTTTASASNASSPEVARCGPSAVIGFAMTDFESYPAPQMVSKPCKGGIGGLRDALHGARDAVGARARARRVPRQHGRARERLPSRHGSDRRPRAPAARPRARPATLQR